MYHKLPQHVVAAGCRATEYDVVAPFHSSSEQVQYSMYRPALHSGERDPFATGACHLVGSFGAISSDLILLFLLACSIILQLELL